MLNIEQIKKALREEDLRVLKSLGQNFLIDDKALDGIVAAAEIDPDDVVVEVGPGMGVLTFALAKKCKQVIAIEKDKKMSRYLEKEMDGKQNVVVINDDILRVNLPQMLSARDITRYKLVANIPYYITSPIIKLFLETEMKPEQIVILIQQEVAERICAQKGDMSILALSVLLYGDPQLMLKVPSSAFYPAPKVDSAVLRIRNIGKRFPSEDYKEIFRLIKIGFSAKRKKLINNLAAGLKLDKAETAALLSSAGIGLDVRAEDLDLEDWVKILKSL